MKQRRQRRPKTNLDISSLMDIIFILLIFVMVSISFSREIQNIPIPLPQIQAKSGSGSSKQKWQDIMVAVDGKILYQQRPLTLPDLKKLCQQKQFDQKSIRLHVDKKAPYETFLKIYTALQDSQASQIMLSAEPL